MRFLNKETKRSPIIIPVLISTDLDMVNRTIEEEKIEKDEN